MLKYAEVLFYWIKMPHSHIPETCRLQSLYENEIIIKKTYTAHIYLRERKKSQAWALIITRENTSYFTFEIRVEWLFFFLSE